MGKRGWNAVRWMRKRSVEKRGGNPERPGVPVRGDGDMASLVLRFLDHMRMRNHTPASVAGRAKELKRFISWSEERGFLYPGEITLPIIEGYQRSIWAYRKKNGKPLSNSMQRGLLGAVRVFFGWLCRQHILDANPASDIELPRPTKQLPAEALTISDVEAVLSEPDIADPLGIRDRAILELFYSTGIRRSELVQVALGDLNRDRRLLYIRHGKGGKQRMVPVGARAMVWLEKYIEDVRPVLLVKPHEPALFLTGYGEPFNPDVLTRKVSRYIKKAGIAHEGAAHLLRHTCATHLLEGGADIRYIQQLLGHENLETTAIYTEVSIVQLQAVHARCHPAERHTPAERER